MIGRLMLYAVIAFCAWVAWHKEIAPYAHQAGDALATVADTLRRAQ